MSNQDARTDAERLADAIHDLRAPLATIIGYQELLADGTYGEIDTEAEEAVARIGEAAEQLLDRLDELEQPAPDD